MQIIDKHGRPLPNIFYGASRDSRVAFELSGRAAAGRTSDRPCLVRKVVYRQSEDPGPLVEVQGRCACDYFVSEIATARPIAVEAWSSGFTAIPCLPPTVTGTHTTTRVVVRDNALKNSLASAVFEDGRGVGGM